MDETWKLYVVLVSDLVDRYEEVLKSVIGRMNNDFLTRQLSKTCAVRCS